MFFFFFLFLRVALRIASSFELLFFCSGNKNHITHCNIAVINAPPPNIVNEDRILLMVKELGADGHYDPCVPPSMQQQQSAATRGPEICSSQNEEIKMMLPLKRD